MKSYRWIKRCINLALVLFFVLCAYQVYVQRKIIVPWKFFSLELFLQERADLDQLVNEAYWNMLRQMKDGPNKERFKILPRSNYDNQKEKKQLPQNVPRAVLVVDCESLEDKECARNPNKFFEFLHNQKAMAILDRALSEVDCDGGVQKDFGWQGPAGKANEFSPSDFDILRRDFPRLAYDYKEIRYLRGMGVILLVVDAMSGNKFEDCVVGKVTANAALNVSLYAYSQYFYKQKRWLYWWTYLKRQGSAIGMFILGGILILRLARSDLTSAVDNENRKRRGGAPQKLFLLPIMSNWKTLLLSAPPPKLKVIARKVILECANMEKANSIRLFLQAAEKAKKGLEKSGVNQGAGSILKSGIDGNKEESGVITACVPVHNQASSRNKADYFSKKIAKRQELLEKLELFGLGDPDKFRKLSIAQLEDLVKKADRRHVERIDDASRKNGRNGSCQPKNNQVNQVLPQDIRVFIVGGKVLYGKKTELIEAVKSLGPQQVEFCEATKIRQVVAISTSDRGKTIVVLMCPPHKTMFTFDSNANVNWYFVGNVGTSRLKSKILEKYYRM